MITINRNGIKTVFERYGDGRVIVSSEYEIPGDETVTPVVKFSEVIMMTAAIPRQFLNENGRSNFNLAKAFLRCHRASHVEAINSALSRHGYPPAG
ncbi:hypothetical protein M942_08575 [Enterobacter ludwigii]|uniref:hypothetical protein n=1 Tax=Enterobacter ludwigii TaxID=299767 RepID=UPI0003D89A62|nr:hypothetical protein [Enterobacter ludwigii]AHE72781.1 hypothetical protein M942_08575 [Enterobacter ludwigii]